MTNRCVKVFPKEPKKICNWIIVEVLSVLNEQQISIKDFKVKPEHIAEIFKLIDEGSISGKIAKDIFKEMITTGDSPSLVIEKKGLKQVSDVLCNSCCVRVFRVCCLLIVRSFIDGRTNVLLIDFASSIVAWMTNTRAFSSCAVGVVAFASNLLCAVCAE